MQEHWCANRQMPAMKLRHKVPICLVLLAASSLPAPAQTVEEEETAPPEPPRIYQAACPALLNGRIKGRILPPIEEGECGENSPIEVTAIGEVDLSNPVTLNCRMATALHGWVDSVDYTALQLLKSQLFSLSVSTSYHCRRRNNAPDGKISEHGFLNALDITGFELANGTRITVLDDWPPVNYEEEEEATSETDDEAPWRKIPAPMKGLSRRLKPSCG